MRERPRSVTVIGWILIVMGGVSGIQTTVGLSDPKTKELMSRFLMPIFISYTVSYLGLFVSLLCGIGMLKARNWARFLYVIWGAISLVITYVNWGTLPGKIVLLPPLMFFLVITLSLFNPKVNEYFTGTEIQGDS
jgi:hypothetical protein